MSLPENLKKFRKAKGLSLAEAASRSAITTRFLRQLESGGTDYGSLNTLYRIAVALDTTIADLLDLPIMVKAWDDECKELTCQNGKAKK